MAVNVCLQMLRYSHVDNLGITPNANWTHISNNNDMYVVLKGSEDNGALTLSVITGTTIMESIDIGSYIDNVISLRQTGGKSGTTVQTDQLPLYAMFRDASLALRYRLKSGVMRRIQLRLHSPADCRKLILPLERRGMDLQERPGTARPNTSTTRPGTSQQEFRPLTGQSSSRFFAQGQSNTHQNHTAPSAHSSVRPKIGASTVQDDEDLYGLSPQRRIANRVGQALEQKVQSVTDSGRDNQEYGTSYSAPHGTSARKMFTRDESIAPREVEPSRPSSRQIWRSHTMQPPPMNTYDMQHPAAEAGTERPSSTSNTANLEAIRQAFEDREPSPNAGFDRWSSSAAGPRPLISSGPPEHRPYTAASATSLTVPDPRGLKDQENPKRPASSNMSRPGSALALPPLRRPSLVKESSAHSSTHQPSSRPPSAIPPIQSQPFDPASYSSPSRHEKALQAPQHNDPAPGMLAPPQAHLGPEVERRVVPMDELLYGPKPLAERSANAGVQRLTSYADAPHEIESPPASAHPHSKSEGLPQPPVTRPGQVTTSITTASNMSLEAYVAQNPSDRETILADFMIENLNNPAFATLCEDIENCWQRQFLGL